MILQIYLASMLDRQDIKDYTFIKTMITAVLPIITSYVYGSKNTEADEDKSSVFL